MDLTLLAFFLVTLASFAVFGCLNRFWPGDRARVHKRLVEEFGQSRPGSASSPLFKDLDALRLAPAEEYALLRGKESAAPSARVGIKQRLESLLDQSRLPLTVKQLGGLCAALAAGLGLAGWGLFGWLGVPAGGLVGALAPLGLVLFRRKARREKFLRQLPAAFELMARVLRAGQSVPQAFQAVAEAFEEPLAGEFSRCQHQQRLGLRPEVVYQEMAQRSDILELRIFVMAMTIQRQTGGNLSEVLNRLSMLLRQRRRLRQRVRTLTAEGRLQGLTLVILPVVMFVAMFFLNRQYALVLLDHPALLAATGGLMAVGMAWIRWIVNFQP